MQSYFLANSIIAYIINHFAVCSDSFREVSMLGHRSRHEGSGASATLAPNAGRGRKGCRVTPSCIRLVECVLGLEDGSPDNETVHDGTPEVLVEVVSKARKKRLLNEKRFAHLAKSGQRIHFVVERRGDQAPALHRLVVANGSECTVASGDGGAIATAFGLRKGESDQR